MKFRFSVHFLVSWPESESEEGTDLRSRKLSPFILNTFASARNPQANARDFFRGSKFETYRKAVVKKY